MSQLWKKRIYLYLTMFSVLPLIRGRTSDRETRKKMLSSQNPTELVISTSADPGMLEYYLTHWNGSSGTSLSEDEVIYYGEGFPDAFFQSQNNSLILRGLSRCLYDFNFVTCLKFLLVNRLENLLDYLRENNLTRTDFSFMMGLVKFKIVPGANHFEERKGALELDEDISYKLMELFRDRRFEFSLIPGFKMDVVPVPNGRDFLSFRVRPYLTIWRNADFENLNHNEVRARKKRKKGGFQMPSMMILPQLIMLGLMPFALANLQAMVMNAFMLNMMALNSAVFMTIRNLVFGPKGGPKIKYVNYGYRKKKKSRVPTIIVHSPAAFVKQPSHLRKKLSNEARPNFYPGDNPAAFPYFYQSAENRFQPVNLRAPENREKGNLPEDDEYEKGGFEEYDHNNKVRIRIVSKEPTSMREILSRIKHIEKDLKGGFIPYPKNKSQSKDEFQSVQVIPIRNSDDLTDHDFDDPRPPRTEEEDYDANYDRDEFMPTVNYRQSKKR